MQFVYKRREVDLSGLITPHPPGARIGYGERRGRFRYMSYRVQFSRFRVSAIGGDYRLDDWGFFSYVDCSV